MATIEYVTNFARNWLRDYPQFFQATVARNDASRTFKLPHQRVGLRDLVVVVTPSSASPITLTSPGQFLLDSRNGVIRITDDNIVGGTLAVEGYHYAWFTEEDLDFYAGIIVREHKLHDLDWQLSSAPEVEVDVIGLGTVVEALWSMLAEVSRDIDVNTPEAIALPLTQRYVQVGQYLATAEAQYEDKAAMLNVGIHRIEVFKLRRRSYTTNRLVPVYREREWDDAQPIRRVFPPIDPAGTTTPPEDFEPSVTSGWYEVPPAVTTGGGEP